MLMALCQNNFAGSPEIVYAPRVAMHHPGGCPELRSRPSSRPFSFFHRRKPAGRILFGFISRIVIPCSPFSL